MPSSQQTDHQTKDKPAGSKNICLFGGTFDPIHLGHIHIAKAAVDALDLDKVIFLPCKQSPHKTGVQHAGEQDRLAMCRLATTPYEWAQVDDFDLKATLPCYSWRTAEAMTARYPGARLFWLMGSDQWQALEKWNRPERLAELVEFIVFSRGDVPEPREGYCLHPITGHHPASATLIRASAPENLLSEWLADDVTTYIREHHLYQKQVQS
jgi:nicotinate-nucleotide adenylyltransferase